MVRQGTLSDFIIGKEQEEIVREMRFEQALSILKQLSKTTEIELRVQDFIIPKRKSLNLQETIAYLENNLREDVQTYTAAKMTKVLKGKETKNCMTFYHGFFTSGRCEPHQIVTLTYQP